MINLVNFPYYEITIWTIQVSISFDSRQNIVTSVLLVGNVHNVINQSLYLLKHCIKTLH